jgi:hypothetical protein
LITVFDHRYSTMSGSSFSFLCVNFLILQKWSNHPYSQNSSLSFLLLCLIFTCKFTFCVFILLNELFVLIILYSSILLFCYDEKVKFTIMFNFHLQIYVLCIYIIERTLCFDYFVQFNSSFLLWWKGKVEQWMER